MNRRIASWPLATVLLATAFFADAQQPTKVPRIGYLTGATPDGQSARIEAFRQGLRELGYVEGKNIVIEYRYAELKLRSPPRARGRASAFKGRCDRYGWGWNHPGCQRSN